MIHVEGLAYTYAGAAAPALRGLDFSVEAGDIFGFLGPSGAGKSTTQKVLIGLLDDYEGSAVMFDREVSEWGSDLYARIGVAAETPNLYHKLTGRENLDLFASLYDTEVEEPIELLERVGLTDEADRRVGTYSKGMQMRLTFVRALLHRPELLFLDEPTGGIDPGNARLVKDVIRRFRADGGTVFLTTHDMTVADELCDRVGFIVDGRLPVIETPRKLKLDYGEPVVRVEARTDGRLETHEFALDALGSADDFQAMLGSGRIETIHTEEATLEDVFIEITGEQLD